ncbi:hypothetical protein MAR_037702 [Mya arenaria]|uniref:DAGKc domain-containing protein n=1 Tax=Mya arenaria TaxID=6604 RepID=A0ABY7FP80_MYAAR|nr:hypothetical protein MAR_037702 [Mya arenaria]
MAVVYVTQKKDFLLRRVQVTFDGERDRFWVSYLNRHYTVTEKAHHTEEILATYDLKSINGLVIVSGDGMYHEAANGLVRRVATDTGNDVNNPDYEPPEFPVTIGLIPCVTLIERIFFKSFRRMSLTLKFRAPPEYSESNDNAFRTGGRDTAENPEGESSAIKSNTMQTA